VIDRKTNLNNNNTDTTTDPKIKIIQNNNNNQQQQLLSVMPDTNNTILSYQPFVNDDSPSNNITFVNDDKSAFE